MQDIKIHFLNYSHVQIECSDSILLEMRDYFSFEVEGARLRGENMRKRSSILHLTHDEISLLVIWR